MEVRVLQDCDISSAASCETKYHPLIMEQTFKRNLSEVSNGIIVERKHAFLYDFHDSLKKILTCVGCDGIRHENSSAFSCGHIYCEICSENLNCCSKCETEGGSRGFIIEQDHSGLLAIIERLQINFNAERVFFEMLKFFLTTSHWLKQGDTAKVIINIIKSPEISQKYNKSSTKFIATSKHFKTRINSNDQFKKKLIFSPNRSLVQPQISKNDSESLFVDSNRKRIPLDSILKLENSDGSVDLQLPVNEYRNSPVVESPGGHRKRAKRKLSKNYLTADAFTEKRCSKTRKMSVKPEVAISSNKRGCNVFKSTKKQTSAGNLPPFFPSLPSTTNAFSENAEGTFIGFIDSEISESYYRFQTAIKCYAFLKSMERKDFSNMATVSSDVPFFNRVDVLCRTGCADSLEKVKMATRPSQSISLENKAHEYHCEEECPKSFENVADLTEMQMRKLRESNLSSQLEIDVVDGRHELAKIHQEESKNTNSVLSLPDPEMEEAVDINLWQHDEKVSRKKKALMFKSVKERNRRRIFFDGRVKLHPTDKVNLVQLKESISLKHSEASDDSQIEDLKQSSLDKMFTKKKEDIIPITDLNKDCRVPDSKHESVSTMVMCSLNGSSSKWTMKTNDESCFVSKSSVYQTCPSKLDVDFPEMGNEENKIQPRIKPNITANSCPVPSTTNSMVGVFPPKFDDNSNLEIESGLLSKSKTRMSNSIEATLKTPPFLTSTQPNINTNLESLSVDIVCQKSIGFYDLAIADEGKNDTSYAIPSKYPQSPVTTYENSSSSVELIRKFSQKTIATISDTVTSDNQNHVGESVTLTPSQPITILSSSSEDSIITANKTNQTAGAFKSDGTVEVDLASSGRLKSDDLFVESTPTKVKCVTLKKAINDQDELLYENIHSSFCFIYPETLSVKKYKGQSNFSSDVNVVDSSLKKVELGNQSIYLPKKSTKPPKELLFDAVNSSNCEKSVFFLTKNSCLTEDILTMPVSPRSKSVSCQTSSDLHISLLKQEFPHLFNQEGNVGKVYGSPDKFISTDSKASDNLKTPQISGTSRHMNFTISPVTSSEKKHFESLFSDRSDLDDSSFHCASVTEKTVDISIQPLPGTGEKVILAHSNFTGEKPYPNAKFTFELDPGVDLEKQKIILDNSMRAASSTPHSQTNAIYYSSVNTNSCKGELDESNLKREANESNSAEFVDSSHENGAIVVSDPKVVLNAFIMEPSTRGISPEAVANHLKKSRFVTSANNYESDNGAALLDDFAVDEDDDDDDVEFIAGTPTGSRRCIDDNLEKLMTQSFSINNQFCEDVSRDNQNDQMSFDNSDSRKQKTPPISQSLIDQSRPLLPPLSVPHLPASEMSDIAQKSSFDLFDSTVATSVQASPSIALVITGLKDTDVKLVKLFCQRFSVSLLDRITSETTHLVVKTDSKNRTARTFKYLQAIVNSICVISIEWVQTCINTDKILNEEKFIPFDSSGECGPLRAYKSRKGVIPSPLSWLRDYCLFFMEPIPSACTLIQLQEIVEKSGAVVITDLKYFRKYATLHHLIIVSDEEDSSQTSNTDIANWLQNYQAVAIEFNWLLEVVGRNRVVPFADYELVEIPSNLLLKLEFPKEMLQYEREDVEDSD